jgi:hypothetical protein
MTTLEQQAGGVIRPFTVQIRKTRSTICAAAWRRRAGRAGNLSATVRTGVQLATMQALHRYWATEYDGGRVESRLNALPQFTTEIDGVDIHFVH